MPSSTLRCLSARATETPASTRGGVAAKSRRTRASAPAKARTNSSRSDDGVLGCAPTPSAIPAGRAGGSRASGAAVACGSGLSACGFCRFGSGFVSESCPSREFVPDSVPSLTGGGPAPVEPLDDPEESPPPELPGDPGDSPPLDPPVGGGFGFVSGTGSGAGGGGVGFVSGTGSGAGGGGVWPAPGSTGKATATTSPVMRTTSQGRIRSLCRIRMRSRARMLTCSDGLAAAADSVSPVDEGDVVSPTARDPVRPPVARVDEVVSTPGD
jgi:hypothetical protein